MTTRTLLVAVLVYATLGCRPAPPDAPTHEPTDAEPSPFRVADFQKFGVTLATAQPGEIDVAVDLPGEVRPNADRLAHLAPRFPGVVREVRKGAGDRVRAGDLLAVIESDTLAPFELKATFDGVVVDRHVAPGETVGRDTPAFILADLSTVWVDAHVYQSALSLVRAGQAARIFAAEGAEAGGTISYITPVVDQATRTASARVVLPNPDGAWRPGLFVTVTVLEPVSAAVAVPRKAVQRVDGAATVFAVDGERFVPRRVVVGRTGRTMAEITAGLAPGDLVADDGSFLVKAELEKPAAGHE